MRQHKSNRKFTWLWKTAALSLAVMLIVHLLYSFDAPLTWLETAWGAGDLLGYWGSIIGAGATIFVLLATIDYEKKADEDRAKRSVRPVIAVSIPEKPFPRWGLVGLTIPEEDFDPIGEGAAYRKAREEYVRADCYAVVSKDGGVSYITKLRNDDYDLALWAEAQVNHGEESSCYGNSFRAWFVKLALVSIGNGPAINVRARIVGQNLGGVAYGERVTCSPATQLMVGGEWVFGILVPAERIDSREYCLVLSYEDADGRAYEQSHVLTLSCLDNIGWVDFCQDIDQREINITN